MNPIILVLLGAGYGFLAGNPQARKQTFAAIQSLAGRGIDALNKVGSAGGKNVQTDTNATSEQQ